MASFTSVVFSFCPMKCEMTWDVSESIIVIISGTSLFGWSQFWGNPRQHVAFMEFRKSLAKIYKYLGESCKRGRSFWFGSARESVGLRLEDWLTNPKRGCHLLQVFLSFLVIFSWECKDCFGLVTVRASSAIDINLHLPQATSALFQEVAVRFFQCCLPSDMVILFTVKFPPRKLPYPPKRDHFKNCCFFHLPNHWFFKKMLVFGGSTSPNWLKPPKTIFFPLCWCFFSPSPCISISTMGQANFSGGRGVGRPQCDGTNCWRFWFFSPRVTIGQIFSIEGWGGCCCWQGEVVVE